MVTVNFRFCHCSCQRHLSISNVTGRHRGPKQKQPASGWLQSAITKTDVTLRRIFIVACGNLCAVRVLPRSGIILVPKATFVPNFVSSAASSAELARGEKLHTQSLNHSLTHPAYLMQWELKLSLRKTASKT